MADPIRLGNFFSTFDTESVIAQLQLARQAPIRKLTETSGKIRLQKTSLTALATSFSALLVRSKSLSAANSVLGKTATVAGNGVTAAATPGAATGAFTVTVSQVASGTSATGTAISAAVDAAAFLANSNSAVPVSSGTFTIKTATGGSAAISVNKDTQSLNDIITAINGSGVGVTATLVNDANGKLNSVQLVSTQGAMTLGAGGDTSNFLSAMNLSASPGTTTRVSTNGIARLVTAAKMNTAAFQGGPPAAGAHTFTVNGVTIAYNTANDSLNDVISRINASTAGVTARYDSVSDTIKMTQNRTGSLAISLADDGTGGDFLAKTGLLTATQAMGTNAQYSIDGGPTQYAETNNVTVNGVSLTLTATNVGSPATVTAGANSAAALDLVKGFVTDFNNVIAAIESATKANGKDTSTSGPLTGDPGVLSLQGMLRSIVSSAGTSLSGNLTTLSQIGLTFGAAGAALGSTNRLQLDETKFQSALATDPASVQALLGDYKLSASLAPGGAGSITGISGQFTGPKAGTYQVTDDGMGNLTAVFNPRDGGPPTTFTGTIAANGTNSTLIPGVTLTAGALAAGARTIEVTASTTSVIHRIREVMEAQSGIGGILTKRQETYDKRLRDISIQQDKMQAHIDAEMALLREKFRAMEQAQSRAQSLISTLDKLNQSNNN
jgi:flagellar hook-associated protein 2